jgi:hypothetical protein
VQPLASVIKVREYGSGKTLSISIPGGELYRTTENMTHATRIVAGAGVMLAPVQYADLEKGDAILVVGRTNYETSTGEALVAVTKFGTFGVVPQAPEDRIVWFIR